MNYSTFIKLLSKLYFSDSKLKPSQRLSLPKEPVHVLYKVCPFAVFFYLSFLLRFNLSEKNPKDVL